MILLQFVAEAVAPNSAAYFQSRCKVNAKFSIFAILRQLFAVLPLVAMLGIHYYSRRKRKMVWVQKYGACKCNLHLIIIYMRAHVSAEDME